MYLRCAPSTSFRGAELRLIFRRDIRGKGVAKTIDLGLPVEAEVDATDVVSLGGETLAQATGMQRPLVIQPVKTATRSLS